MIDSSMLLERFLQHRRFERVKKHLNGSVLDFGGNEGELKKYVKGEYLLVNYDHTPMLNRSFDTIVLLAVVEHIDVDEVYRLFAQFKGLLNKGGIIFLTTPTPSSKFILEFLAWAGFLDKQNIEEHKHYWSRIDLKDLAEKSKLKVVKHEYFQLGFNQSMIMCNL